MGLDVTKGLMEQVGMQAGVPTVARVQSPADLGFVASNSVDCVVCLRRADGMGNVPYGRFLTVRY